MRKKPGPKGPREDSAATYIRGLILKGKTNPQIESLVKRRFKGYKLYSPQGKSRVDWYRWQLRRWGVR